MNKVLVVLLISLLFGCDPYIKKEYHENGNIKTEIQLSNGEGFGKVYYPNGKIHKIASFKNGKREGKFVTYYENGKIETEENYKEDSLDGPTFLYYKDGKNMGEDFYRNGRIISGGSFNRNGDSVSVHRGNVIRTYSSSGEIYVLDCLANTHKVKSTGTIKFNGKGEILEYKGPLTCLTKNDTLLLDARNPEWRNLKNNIEKRKVLNKN